MTNSNPMIRLWDYLGASSRCTAIRYRDIKRVDTFDWTAITSHDGFVSGQVGHHLRGTKEVGKRPPAAFAFITRASDVLHP
jgi:hypothetical protein